MNKRTLRIVLFFVAVAMLGLIPITSGVVYSFEGPGGELKAPQWSHVHADGQVHNHLGGPVAETEKSQAGFRMDGHEASEGPLLRSDTGEHTATLFEASACPEGATVKQYDVAAIPVTMVLNRWGDRDPQAYMYALQSDIAAIRAQEALADDAEASYGLSLGLGGDAIQPLTLRANVGECLRINFENQIEDPASFHVHGADLVLADSGVPALSTNPDSVALPGQTIRYEWYIDPSYYGEDTHYVHSHGPKARYQVSHGLFGAVVVLPAGSEYFDQRSGEPLCTADESGVQLCRSAWDAMISPGDGSADFREFAMFYHEIGNAKFSAVDKDGVPNPNIDPVVESYKPNGRAINYRSESFWRRMGDMIDAVGYADESQAYGSYAFGEPSMPVPQSYLGDPVKFRLIHGGSETFHVPHLHGGGIQWQRQQDVGKDSTDPDYDYTPIDAGLKKEFGNQMPSSGNDSQTIGPSETYELEISCGSGGCQQTVGDFLFHCHVASHYISGMWHFWRVYNTLQDGPNKTDDLAVLAELPDRAGRVAPAVTSEELVGQTVEFAGNTTTITADNLAGVVETQLPPAGEPMGTLDAAVWNWNKEGLAYYGEPETGRQWVNFVSATPGERPLLKFDPATGKLAFPFLRPHLGQRPPFAPNHGPAPYLEPANHDRAEPAPPGSNGPDSLCPTGAPVRTYKIHAIQTDIPVTNKITDNSGMIFVVKENEERARSDPEYKEPLAIRANQGDCVDIIFVNELEETGEDAELSKTNIHIHFVQFDTQASDGVISGMSYEQSPRPFIDPQMSFKLQETALAGDDRLVLDDASSFHVGSPIGVGMDQLTADFETAVIKAIEGNTLVLDMPLKVDHAAGQLISVEYVRYRWFVARQNGAIYFHDHVDALNRWGHGLFGTLIAEPRDSQWLHPRTGEPVLSGTKADIVVDPAQQILPGLKGSFREFVLFMSDHNPLTGSAFNLRAEPLYAETERGQGPPDLAFSSIQYGDPHTPLLQAYVGDPVMLRLLTTATEEIHPFHITGHRFRWERFEPDSPELSSFGVGISERFNAFLKAAGGPAGKAGDYFYYNGAERHLMQGSWGIFRVYDSLQAGLRPLPGNVPQNSLRGFPYHHYSAKEPGRSMLSGYPCPSSAPLKEYAISAIQVPLVFNELAAMRIPLGRMYALDSDVEAYLAGTRRPEPLVIRANEGDCLLIRFTNRMDDQPASIQMDSLALDPQHSLGVTVGYNLRQSARPGETKVYRYYADREVGTVLMRDFGNVFRNAREGLYGALIVEPAGSTYLDPYTSQPLASGVAAVIANPDQPDFREFVTLFQDNDPDIGLFVMPYDEEVNRLVGVNYRAAPLALRLAQMNMLLDADVLAPEFLERSRGLYNSAEFGEPETNVFEAYAGEPVRFRVLSAFSEQPQVFYVEGHEWKLSPELAGSDVVSSRYLPPTGVLDVSLLRTGGPQARPGDYQWANHRLPYEKAGQWGLLRVLDPAVPTSLLKLSN